MEVLILNRTPLNSRDYIMSVHRGIRSCADTPRRDTVYAVNNDDLNYSMLCGTLHISGRRLHQIFVFRVTYSKRCVTFLKFME